MHTDVSKGTRLLTLVMFCLDNDKVEQRVTGRQSNNGAKPQAESNQSTLMSEDIFYYIKHFILLSP